jgi:hypothetical protein
MPTRRKYPLEFQDGERVDAAKLTVVKRPEEMPNKFKAIYLVRFDCCGELGKISRDGIVGRIREGTPLCQTCNAHHGGSIRAGRAVTKKGTLAERLLPEGVTPPMWKPPALVFSKSAPGRMKPLRQTKKKFS